MKQVTIILAIILILLVMGATTLLASINKPPVSYSGTSEWGYTIANPQAVKIIDLTGDGTDDVFVQGQDALGVLDANGNAIYIRDITAVATMGDVNGDNIEDIIVARTYENEGVQLLTLRGDGTEMVNTIIPAHLAPLSRIALIRFASGPQIIVGDDVGQLLALDTQGSIRWQTHLSSGDYIRGLDDVSINGIVHLAAANHDGAVALYTEQGEQIWLYPLGQDLRRLRAFDLDSNGTTELFIGGDDGKLVVFESGNPEPRISTTLGQAITQIRDGETDGDPTSREFVVGGKDGGLWAFHLNGTQLWSATLADRVNDIALYDSDSDGQNEVFVGDESGAVTMFLPGGADRFTVWRSGSTVVRLSDGNLAGHDRIVVADEQGVQSLEITRQTPPFWYNPLLAGVVLSLIIIIIAAVLVTLPQKPAPVLETETVDQSVEGLKAQRTMLHERIADVERLKATGDMPAATYNARLKQLRKQLAANETALLKAGEVVEQATLTCPNCGGELQPGQDRCSYCGTTIIR